MKKSEQYSISIIIPNKNGAELLEKNLPSVIAASRGAEIIVADDNSDDGSAELLKRKFPGVRVVNNTHGKGFSGTVNTGSGIAGGEIILLLNTDIVPEPDFLMPLIRHFDDKNIFAVGCMDKSHEAGGIILRGRGEASWRNGFYIHRRGEVDRTDTAWVSGGSGAFRKSYWERLGGMDELYNPFYWEDIDLSYRARKAGYRILFEPGSIVHHYHEKGVIKQTYSAGQIKTIAYRNQFIFIWKNLTDINIWFTHIFRLPLRLIRDLFMADGLMVLGAIMAMKYFPEILRRRKILKLIQKIPDRDL
jgi:GT2 family glycosyltransferase